MPRLPLRPSHSPERPPRPSGVRPSMRPRSTATLLATLPGVLVVWLLLLASAGVARAQDVSEETVDYFQRNCASCHTVGGGKLVGPDLKGVTERAETKWAVDFILDPKGVIDSGDAYAQQILRESGGVYMPQTPGLTRSLAEKLVHLIEVESAKEKSRFAGLQLSDRPLTPADVELGRALFHGDQTLEAGGPACFSCHTVAGAHAFGGGRLGPDLTDAYARLDGRKALAAWLAAPPSVTMQPLYGDRALTGDEVLALVAYMKDQSETGRPGDDSGPLGFLLAGVGGLVVALLGFDLVWRRRFRGVRRSLIARASLRGGANSGAKSS